MRPTVLLFDIDGTLITTDGAGRRAIERAFVARHGQDGACSFSLAGMTDRAIARKGLLAIGKPCDEAEITALLEAYVGLLDAELQAAKVFRVLPGIEAALDATVGRAHVAVGLGTGNVRAGAEKKLTHARLWHRFAFGGFADDNEQRPALIRAGAERGAQRLKTPLDRCRVVVIGDTPLDVAAARENGFQSLAVATGQHPLAELRSCGADHACADLRDPGARALLIGE